MSRKSKIDVVGVRLVRERAFYSTRVISNPDIALEVVGDRLSQYDREVIAVLNLDSAGRIVNVNVSAIGCLDSAPVHPREVFKAAILSNAQAIMVMHNHPSGNLEPSKEDRSVCRRLGEAGRLMGIPLLDFLITGDGRLYSFASHDEMRKEARHD